MREELEAMADRVSSMEDVRAFRAACHEVLGAYEGQLEYERLTDRFFTRGGHTARWEPHYSLCSPEGLRRVPRRLDSVSSNS